MGICAHRCSSRLQKRTRRFYNFSDIMVKFLAAIVLVLAVGAIAKPHGDESIKKTIEAPAPVVTEAPVVVEKPEPVEPVAAEPVAAEPVVPEPVVAEPVAAEPVAAEPVVAEPVVAEPVAAEPVAAEPVADEPTVEEKPVVVEEPVVAEEPVEKTKLEGHLECLKNAKWAPAQLLNCGKKMFHCVWCMMTQW